MLLSQFVERYCENRDLAAGTKCHMQFSVRALNEHAQQPIKVRELSASLVEEWIESRLKAGRTRMQVVRQRGAILTLWRAAHAVGLIESAPKNIRVVKLRLKPPQAWWPDDFAKILAAIETMPGSLMCGVPKRLFFKAFALVGYYSGLRPSDVRCLRCSDIAPDGRLVVMVQKTGMIFDCVLPSDAMAAIALTRPAGRDFLFPISRKNLCTIWRDISKRARVPGTPKWLRRTGATRCEQQQPGSAKAFLGHLTDGLAAKHYVDPRQIQSKRPLPPPLEL